MHDDPLTNLISDAVADVEPTDRLAEIRERTGHRSRRHAWYAVGGASLAAAAAVTAIALASNQTTPKADDPGIATQSPSATEPSGTPDLSAYPVYYLGETPTGTRLYREFQQAEGINELPVAIQLLSGPADDPDYWTPWPAGAFETARVSGGVIEVVLADETLHDRPADMDPTEAAMAVEQVIYTMQAVAGDRFPVQFRLGDNPIDKVLGVQTSEALANAPQLQVLSLVSISNPTEGLVVSGSFTADGAASSFEATVPWEIQDAQGIAVEDGFATATGYMERLYPWVTEVDVSTLEPGTYTFVAMTSDPSAGAEGPGAYSDTRTIVVE